MQRIVLETIVTDALESAHEVLAPAIRTDAALLATLVHVFAHASRLVQLVPLRTLAVETTFSVDARSTSTQRRVT